MGRKIRLHLPGVPFHITARLQGRVPLFVGAEEDVAKLIIAYSTLVGVDLIAYAVMDNHLHIVAIARRKPLPELMQPLLRRIALLVRRRHRVEGHVFERRYHAQPCLDATYLRNAIAYVHLNPVRRGLCKHPVAYAHTSHSMYCSQAEPPTSAFQLAVVSVMRLFAERPECSISDCRTAYLRFVRWRIGMDEYAQADAARRFSRAPEPPLCIAGDDFWLDEFGDTVTAAKVVIGAHARPRHDLSVIATSAIRDLEPDMPLDLLRSGSRSKPVTRVRREVVLRAVQAGYTATQIARFLHIQPGSVSRLAAPLRAPVLFA